MASAERPIDRILFILLAVLIASLPFEFQSFPLLSNLQWVFAAVCAAALPIVIRDRHRLIQDRLVRAALLFVVIQWVAALWAPEFTGNAVKGAFRVTAGFALLCATLCVRDRGALFRVWSVSAVLAALYGVFDYNGLGIAGVFRATDFYFGSVVRLSGSFEYPNTAAAFFALSLPIVWTAPKSQWFRITGSLLIWAALVMTYLRGAAIAVLLMLAIWAMVSRAKLTIYFCGLCAGVFIALLALQPFLLQRFEDPQPARALSAEYKPEFNLLRRRPDEAGDLVVQVTNAGTTTWFPGVRGQRFALASRWYDPEEKRLIRTAMNYTPISRPIRPDESVIVRAPFVTPGEPGLYLLAWDLFLPGTGWFSGNGVLPGVVEVNIHPGNEPWSGHGDVSRWYGRETSRLFVANLPFSRSELWRSALDMARSRPILGVGPDNFRLLYGRRFNLPNADPNIRSNSLYLELLAGSGVLGLAAFGIMMSAVRRRAVVPLIALGIFLVHGLVDVFLMTTPIYFAFWILLGKSARMHIVCVNYAYNRRLTTTDSLLDRYGSLSGYADGLTAAGARVSVVQRFGADIDVTCNAVLYRFVRDPGWKHGSLLDRPFRMHRAIRALAPDVVHVNGLQFARQASQLQGLLGNGPVPILLQDHANGLPRRWLNRWTLRRAMRRMDAVSFVSREQASPWQAHGFLNPEQVIVELMEGSSRFCLQPRESARARSGLTGAPLCLWVGRLNANKDPLTVLRGFAESLAAVPGARLAMVYGAADLLSSVHDWLAKNPAVAERVTLLGPQPHAALEVLYNSADLFLLGSHHEGSGYAVLEALACGVVPVVTDIPSFRVLTDGGTVGELWPVGDAEGLARGLADRYSRLNSGTPQEVRRFFDANFQWKAIGLKAVSVYQGMLK